MSDMILFDQSANTNLPAHLAGLNTGVGTALMAAIGVGGNRIGLKGSRFRIIVNGNEEAVVESNSLNVIVVGAIPDTARLFYEGKYKQDEKSSPTCYSRDGKVPAEDVKNKQSSTCDLCPQNVKGSKIGDDGYKGKACGYFRRLVVMLADDPENRLFRLDVKAMSLFGESHEKLGRYALNDYAKFLDTRKVDVGILVTQLSFDTDASVPKVLFKALGYINEYQLEAVQHVIESNEVSRMLEINMQTVDISAETLLDDAPVTEAPTPQQRPAQAAPQQAAQAPVQAQKPVTRPAPVASKPSLGRPPAAAQTVAVAVEDAPIPAAKPAPVVQQAAPVATQAPLEIGDDAEFNSILAGLDL